MPQFNRYIGIDYSGAVTPESSCKGLRVYVAEGTGTPEQIQPPSSPRLYWTRRGLAEWLCDELAADIPTIVGIDHGFSFPIEYFDRYRLPRDWPNFLLDFQKHWPTHEPHTYIDSIRDGSIGQGSKRMGENAWLRLTERWTATAKSVFMFDVQGSLAKSTHAGLPWLLYLRKSFVVLHTSDCSPVEKYQLASRSSRRSTQHDVRLSRGQRAWGKSLHPPVDLFAPRQCR